MTNEEKRSIVIKMLVRLHYILQITTDPVVAGEIVLMIEELEPLFTEYNVTVN